MGSSMKTVTAQGWYGMWAHEYVRVGAVALAREDGAFSDVLVELANQMEQQVLDAGLHRHQRPEPSRREDESHDRSM